MDFIACINSVDCAMPANIETAVALEVKQPCSVGDAYQILTNYPSLKYIRVAGETYSRQTIGQMPIDGRLGGQILEPLSNLDLAPPWEPTPTAAQGRIFGNTQTGITGPLIWIDEAISPDDVYGLPI